MLAELLAIGSLEITAKSLNLLAEYEHVLTGVRLLTDVRPVFKEPSAEVTVEEPAATVIVHTLKLTYMKGTKVKEIFIALDPNGLDELQDALDRAKAKEDSVKEALAETKLRYLGIEE